MKKTRAQQETERTLTFLHSRGVRHFVHFTALDNIDSILEYGLMPRSSLEDKKISYQANDNLRLDGSSHVNLSITHPNIRLFYKFRKANPSRQYIVLFIKPEILYEFAGNESLERYAFSSTNAASNRAMRCNVEQLFAGQRPFGYRDEWTTDSQAEILIPGIIPPQFIESIVLPSAFRDDEDLRKEASNLASQIADKGLSCKVTISDVIFGDIRQELANSQENKKFEYYFMSWQTAESDYAFLESEIEKTPSRSVFGSVAVPTNALESNMEHYRDPNNRIEWSLTFHRASSSTSRPDKDLTALAVIEKIINRSSVGLLSFDLENTVFNLILGPYNGQHFSDTKTSEYYASIFLAHQIQCTLIELLKHQRLSKGSRLQVKWNGSENNVVAEIAKASLHDLSELAQTVSQLYRCNNPLSDIQIADTENPNFVLNCNSLDEPSSRHEATLSPQMKTTRPSHYDPIQVQTPAETYPTPNILRKLLWYIFRFPDFREGQYPALARALGRKDTIVLLPTGSGKSIIFQLLALITPGTAFIVSPITSLIDDQVQNLLARGIDRVVGLTAKTANKRAVEQQLATGQFLMCYSSPERFQSQSFINSVKNYARENLVSVVAIDEAHCVSEWGHNFRASYLGLARSCREACSTNKTAPPLLALTGTASASVLTDMKNDLEITGLGSIIKPDTFDRPELHYRVIATKSQNKLRVLDDIMQNRLPGDLQVSAQQIYEQSENASPMSGIVFCQYTGTEYGIMNSERGVNYGHPGVWDYLSERYPNKCAYYCGKKPDKMKKLSDSEWEKRKAEQAASFKANNTSIMVATNAFGMGIDKSNVRWIVHFGMPGSLESYYQEVGRAARDKRDAYVYLILSDDFPYLNDRMLDPSISGLSSIQSLDSSKGEYKGDDISRCLFLHRTSFTGVEDELAIATNVFNQCTQDNLYDDRWRIPFSSSDADANSSNKNILERAIYRLTLLGAFRGYTIEYTGKGFGLFFIEPPDESGKELREKVAENYLTHIAAYQSDAAFLKQSKRNFEKAVEGIKNDRDYILRVLRHLLIHFTYKVIEEGRRRAMMTMLDIGRRTAEISDVPSAEAFFRQQITNYLSTEDEEDEELGLSSIIENATNVKKLLTIIERAIKNKEEAIRLQQALRLLEDYPQNYGLYYIVSALQARENRPFESARSVKSMVHFGVEDYGLKEEKCIDNYLRFLRSPLAKTVSLDVYDETLRTLSENYKYSYAELLEKIPFEKKESIMSIGFLESIMTNIDEEMEWKTASTRE